MGSLFEDIKALGINLVPVKTVAKTGLLGIENLKEVASPVCELVVLVVNKEGMFSYAKIIPDIFPAVSGFDQVDNELFDMDEKEVIEFRDFVKGKLSAIKGFVLEGEFERIVDRIAFNVIDLGINIFKLTQLKKAA